MKESTFNDNKSSPATLKVPALLALSAVITVCMLGWVLWYCRFGIDFTDESFYLVWMSNPFNYSVSVTQFGFIYHPLYELLDGNIAALRQANLLVTYCLAWVLGNIFLKTIFSNQPLEKAHQLIISAAFATASIVTLRSWIPTPNYNWLTLQALLVTAIGLLLSEKKATRESVTGWFLIGIGGWLAFMAKPTTAVVLGLCTGIYLLAAGKINLRLWAIALGIAAICLLFFGVIIDGSIITFIDRLTEGKEAAELLGGGHTLAHSFKLDDFLFDGKEKLIFSVATAAIFSAAYFFKTKIRALEYAGATLSMAFAFASVSIVFGLTHKTLDDGRYRALLLCSIPFAAILVGLASYRFKGLARISRSQWALALIFLMLPYAYAFGTVNNYWWTGSHAGIFWVFAGLVFLSPIAVEQKFTALLLPFGFAVQFMTVALVQTGIEAPYRQPQTLRENDYKIDVGRQGSTLLLTKSFSQYITEAIGIANQAQFKQGTPVIDLSGQSPGILYALGANNIGQAWNIGGFPGSDQLVVKMLNKVSCEKLSISWLLEEPEGKRKISPKILSSFGANMATDFEIVGTFKTAQGVGGNNEMRVQQLLKPIRTLDAAMAACTASRPIRK